MLSNNVSDFSYGLIKNRRERWLAIVLVGVIALAGLYRIAGSGWGWSNDESLLAARLSSECERLKEEIDRQESVTLAAQRRQAASLPADGVLATTRYYAWLHELASRHGMAEIKIDNTAPIADSALGNRIQFALQARADMQTLGKFLDELQSYALLHTITHLQLQDYSPLSGEVRLQLNLEALSLSDAKDTALPEPDTTQSKDELSGYFAEHNPFRRYEPPKPVVTATVASLPVVDPLSKVTFVGVVQRGGVKQAWFFDSLNNQEILLNIGAQLSVGDFVCRLESVEESSADLAKEDKRWSIQLGQDLRATLGTPQ